MYVQNTDAVRASSAGYSFFGFGGGTVKEPHEQGLKIKYDINRIENTAVFQFSV